MELFGLQPGEPALLWGLVAVPVLTVLYLRSRKHKPSMPTKYPQTALVKRKVSNPLWRRDTLAALMVLAWVLMCFTLAQFSRVTEVPADTSKVVLLIDDSRSSSVVDCGQDGNRTRIECEQDFALQVLEIVPSGHEAALGTFSAEASLVVRPTINHALVASRIEQLTVSEDRGTDLSGGVYESIRLCGDNPSSCHVVLISDGDDTTEQFNTTLSAVREAGLPVSTYTVGTPTGSLDGTPMAANQPNMNWLAEESGGISLNGETTLDELRTEFTELDQSLSYEQREAPFPWFGFALAVVLAIRLGLSLHWFNRL